MEKYQNVDFTRLHYGEKEFFLGQRTLHPEEEKPKLKLKEYHRKVFYDEEDDNEEYEEFIEEKKEE